MIISHIIGGLGNQMFQYALGRHLSLKFKTEFKLDTWDYKWYKVHDYGLHYYFIKAGLAQPNEVLDLKTHPIVRPFMRKSSHIIERGMPFDPQVLDSGDNVYLEGYWASEQYFKPISEVIRNDLELQIPLSESTQFILKEIR